MFNVANGNSITIKALCEKIIELVGSKSKINFADERAGDIKHSLASIEETVAQLAFQPSFSLDEGLNNTIKYFQDLKA